MEFTAQNVEYAVSVFYHGEQNDRANAHTWLTTAQRVPEAWTFVWELLQPTKGTEVQFYAATTLHTKILRCWNEVPSESYDQLQEKLLQAVFTYSAGPKIVTNRLCISLAAFILQQGTVDLATILRPLSSVENTSLLLEVLTVLPEEYNSMTMGTALRSKNRALLRQACPAVLDDMLRHLQTVYNDYSKEPPSEQIIQSWTTAANCASSWLTTEGEDLEEFGPPLPDRLPLFRALLTAVHILYTCNEIVSDSALDACEACMSAARAAGGTGDAARYPAAALEVFNCLSSLVAPIMAKDNVPNSVNEELLSAMITCCVSLGEIHARCIVESIVSGEERGAGARKLVEILLDAQATPGRYPLHETRSNLVFGFWYTLQDEILNILEHKSEMNVVWREVFCRLLTVLIHKSEAVVDSMMSKDDLELLRCYRQDIADSVMYCYAILGEWCWNQVESELSNGSGPRQEAALHVFLALSDAAPLGRGPPALVSLLRQAVRLAERPDSPRTLQTALHCLGAYSSWLSNAGASGASLARECVAAAGAALHQAPAPAALALRKLCSDCTGPAAALAPDIVRAAQNSRGHDGWTRRQLVGAAGAALAANEPAVAAPLLADLAAMLHQDLTLAASDPSKATVAAECCSALTQSLSSQLHLIADLLRALAPVLHSYAVNPPLVEPLFNILKQVVSSMMVDVVPLLGDIAELTVTAFNHHPCASGLDHCRLIVILCGSEWPECRDLLRACVSASARQIALDPPAAPDLAEGLFTALTAIGRKVPQYLDWIDDLLSDLVGLACQVIRVWEVGASRAACACVSVIAQHNAAPVQPHAPAIVDALLRCIGGASPRNQIEPLAELLLGLNRAEWRREGNENCLGVWLRDALSQPNFPTAEATDAYKQKFITSVVKEKASKRRLLETVQEFSLVCRGLVNTEYARQSIAAKLLVQN